MGPPVRVDDYDAAGAQAIAWLPDPTASTGSPLADSTGGVGSWMLSDPFANTVATVSTTGNTVSGTRTMDAFGVERSSATGSLADSAVGFAGQYLDTATGLYDMRARDYDPASGRFTATDPVAVPTGMPYVAGYSYSYNNPLMYSDASGLTACGPIGSDCNGANLVPQFRRLERANNDSAYLNLYRSLTAEQANEIPFDDLSYIHAEAQNRQMHQMACEDSPGGCWAPCPEQDYQRCQLERGAFGFGVYFAAPMLLGAGASAVLGRACATIATRTAAADATAARTTAIDSAAVKGVPKTSPNFKPPTNAPQLPPTEIPAGWRVRKMPPTADYPNGYWKLEKPMADGKRQPIDPSTMKPGTRPETHVPFPGGG